MNRRNFLGLLFSGLSALPLLRFWKAAEPSGIHCFKRWGINGANLSDYTVSITWEEPLASGRVYETLEPYFREERKIKRLTRNMRRL